MWTGKSDAFHEAAKCSPDQPICNVTTRTTTRPNELEVGKLRATNKYGHG